MKGFFLGNRGAWALALTATVQERRYFYGISVAGLQAWLDRQPLDCQLHGGPDYRLRHYWQAFGTFESPYGRRHCSGSFSKIRFNDPAVGFTCTIFLLLYMSFLMFAQFKAGAMVIQDFACARHD